MTFNGMKSAVCALMIGSLAVSCSKDSEAVMTEEIKVSNATAINRADLIGSWDLTRMLADAPVDLDENGTSSANLLDETTCFNTMSITFNNDGTFNSNNATMTFEGGTTADRFECIADRQDSGSWEVSQDTLVLTMKINADTFTHKKALDMTSNTFSFDVNKLESEQYVNDPGDTQASGIRILELEYTRR